jgi:hypothetical protein
MGPEVPKAFISHASDDKERFVLDFARRLRERGVDAWLAQWEIAPGDSLVERIFDEGIGQADAFVVVLSKLSVTKPWVREELDAGVVRRISERCRLIPVVLDDVEVPLPLRHLRWLLVNELGIDAVIDEIVRTLFGWTEKPLIGPPPGYVDRSSSIRVTGDPVDDRVFSEIVATLRDESLNLVLFTNEIQERLANEGIDSTSFFESLEVLRSRGLIDADEMAGGARWWIHGVPYHAWLDAERAAGVDVEELELRLLAHAANHPRGRLQHPESTFGVPIRTVAAALESLQSQGLLSFARIADGDLVLLSVSVVGHRVLRNHGGS